MRAFSTIVLCNDIWLILQSTLHTRREVIYIYSQSYLLKAYKRLLEVAENYCNKTLWPTPSNPGKQGQILLIASILYYCTMTDYENDLGKLQFSDPINL